MLTEIRPSGGLTMPSLMTRQQDIADVTDALADEVAARTAADALNNERLELVYEFSELLGGSPGDGILRLNDALILSATRIFASYTDSAGVNRGLYLNNIQRYDNGDIQGRVRLVQRMSSIRIAWAEFLLTQVVDNTTWVSMVVERVANSTTAFTDGLPISIQFAQSWDRELADEVAARTTRDAELTALVVGGQIYKGTWNATTNSPTIPAAAGGNQGWLYQVAVAGTTTINGISVWGVGDIIISNGSVWQKIANVVTDISPTVQVFTADGTWTRPAGCKCIRVRLVGAGGGGGGGAVSGSTNGSGGSAGGYSEEWLSPAPAAAAVTVGAGGTGGGDGADGIAGGATSFGALLSATGGGQGRNDTFPLSGGTGSGGDVNITGQRGGSVAVTGGTMGGIGGASTFGGGGMAGGKGAPAVAAVAPGGGGGGGRSTASTTGGSGANGIAIVEEFF